MSPIDIQLMFKQRIQNFINLILQGVVSAKK